MRGGKAAAAQPAPGRFIQKTLELTGVFLFVPFCNLGIASRTARLYNPLEAHESKSLDYVFWR
jgi:hypothetical protein